MDTEEESLNEYRIAWLSLEEGDSDLTRFLAYLIAALQTIVANIGEGVLGVLQSPQVPPTESILTALLHEITTIPDSFTLVLDDNHVVDAKPIDDALTFLLEHQPSQMHLIIATRSLAYDLMEDTSSITRTNPVKHLKAAPDQDWIVLLKDKRLVVWDSNGKVVKGKTLPSLATCLDASQDGRIAIGSRSGYARVYYQNLKEIFKDKVQKSKIVQLMFSVDGKQLLSIGNDRSLRRTYL